MLGENLETARDLVRRIDGVIDAERPRYSFLDYAERTISFPLTINKRITVRGVFVIEAKIGERRSVGETLEDAIEVARVAEVP